MFSWVDYKPVHSTEHQRHCHAHLSPSPPHPRRLTLVNVDFERKVLISTIRDRKRSGLVHLQSNTANFTVSAGTTSRHYRALFVSLPFYCGIIVSIAPHPHGNSVRRDPIPMIRECGPHFHCDWLISVVCVLAFVLNHAEVSQFRPECVSYMQKTLRQLLSQSKLKHTGLLISIAQCCANIRNFELNSYFSIRFDSKRTQLFEIFECLLSPISYPFNRMTPMFHLSNHT